MNKKLVTILAILTALVMMIPLFSITLDVEAKKVAPGIMDPKTIPQFVNQLTSAPPVYAYELRQNPITMQEERYYTVDMSQFQQQVLPTGLPMTTVWGYGGNIIDPSTGAVVYAKNSPGPSFEAQVGLPLNVKWVNNIVTPHMFPVDPTLHWADPNIMGHVMVDPLNPVPYPPGYSQAQSPVPLVTHLHGGEVRSTSDGGPEAWWTNGGLQGMDYNTEEPTDANAAVYRYPNSQLPTTLWYHDHALGITRINVMSGLAGFYLLRDPTDPIEPLLPSGQYEIPLAIQDRTFQTNGEFWFPSVGLDPAIHPYWQPEFFGNTIMVNGKVWPNMNVDQGQYRLRILDGSNARFYTLSFWVPSLGVRLPFTVIGTDGGYLGTAATVNQLTVAPGERYDVLVDFSGLPPGTKVIMDNKAKAPFPNGAIVDPKTTGRIMQFTVGGNPGFVANALPAVLNPTIGNTYPSLAPAPVGNQRILTLQEVMGPLGPTMILLNGQTWMDPTTEIPTEGETEEWVIVNPTADTHPIHLHLVQFQLVSRQAIDIKKYDAAWIAANGMAPVMGTVTPIPIGPYLKGAAAPPNPWESGWKDTIQMNPGEVTIIRIRFSPQDGSSPYFNFDPSQGPGYVWHCHILDHEDNEMMRRYTVIASSNRPIP